MVIISVDVHLNYLNWFCIQIIVGGLCAILVILVILVDFLLPFLDVIMMSLKTLPFPAQVESAILCLQNAFF